MKTAVKTLDDLASLRAGGIDLLICSASFEERCLSIPLRLAPEQVNRVAIMSAGRQEAHVSQNLDQLLEHFGTKAVHLSCSLDDPICTFDVAARELEQSGLQSGHDAVWIDMSTLTHEWVLMLYHILCERLPRAHPVRFLYNRAAEYALGLPSTSKWLSQGIREVRSVLGYPGALTAQAMHLILLVGFEFERALALIETYEPHRISLGRADLSESNAAAHAEAEAWHASRVRDARGETREFRFPAYDVEGTTLVLEDVIASSEEALSTVIAPMNTKLSTLGVACLAKQRSEIQVCYAQPVMYNYTAYSQPGQELYVVECELG